LAKADVDAWTAAYFLDRVTEEQYTQRWDATNFAAMTWFYVGSRSEVEGRADAARAAYRKSFALAAPVGGNLAGNWAGYRLDLLERRQKR
jgi:predicted TPR repeat methyltransferase